jgi:hypothetical protein
MKKMLVFILLLSSVSTGLTKSQISTDEMSSTLDTLFGRLRSVAEDSVRLRINDSIISVVESYSASGKVFKHTFSKLRYLGQITSSDSLIKIITWNLVLRGEPGRYYCYFIRRGSEGDPDRVYRLTHPYDDKQIASDTIYTASDWYGALYYDIRPFMAENRQCWVLLGINYSNPLMTRKIIDVLSFTPEGKIIFGRKWFDSGGSINFRHILEYSSSAMISLRFSSDSTIVFDHLVPLPPSGDDDRLYNGPDYSYDAYIFENGVWSLSINIDARNRK